MIFMKFLARSSRTTGPKIRVPTGSPGQALQHAVQQVVAPTPELELAWDVLGGE